MRSAALSELALTVVLGLCACGSRSEPGSAARTLPAGSNAPIPAVSMLPEPAAGSIEPGFVAGERYDHDAVARLQPQSTSVARAIEILRGQPVRRLDFAGGMYSLLWSYAARWPLGEDEVVSVPAGTERDVRSGVEVLFDPSGRMIQVLDSQSEDGWAGGEWSPTYGLPEELRPTSIGQRVRLGNLRAMRVTWFLKHGGARIAGLAYDHAQVPQLKRGTTTDAGVRQRLGGEPVQRDEYDDGSYELTWNYRTERLATAVRLRFGPDGVLRAFVSASPDFIGLRRDTQSTPRTDIFAAPPARHLRTIDLQAGG